MEIIPVDPVVFCDHWNRLEFWNPNSGNWMWGICGIGHSKLPGLSLCRICHLLLDMAGKWWTVCAKGPASHGLAELSACHCQQSSCRQAVCICRRNSLPWTEANACMAYESCQNHNIEHWLSSPLMMNAHSKECHWYCHFTILQECIHGDLY